MASINSIPTVNILLFRYFVIFRLPGSVMY
jgi:hypothetical protein